MRLNYDVLAPGSTIAVCGLVSEHVGLAQYLIYLFVISYEQKFTNED